jgi:hypothetical protein
MWPAEYLATGRTSTTSPPPATTSSTVATSSDRSGGVPVPQIRGPARGDPLAAAPWRA